MLLGLCVGSIHPQGWVPIETYAETVGRCALRVVAFTPKGGCPLKPVSSPRSEGEFIKQVAFTPKGGCPLKRPALGVREAPRFARVAFTPKGGCPLKLNRVGVV